MFVPLHDGHQIKQYSDRTEHEAQGDIAFAARTLCIIIPHVSAKAGKPASFSTIRAAKRAVI